MLLKVKENNTIHLINSEEIIFCRSAGNYTQYVLRDKKVISYQSLKEIEELLCRKSFCRCHNSFLVNLNEISEFDTKNNNLQLKGRKTILPVSKFKRHSFIKALEEFINKKSL
jgi:two-component system LytT family response regulator